MAGRGNSTTLVVRLDYQFDRTHADKLANAYGILVPHQTRSTGAGSRTHDINGKETQSETGRNLRQGIVR